MLKRILGTIAPAVVGLSLAFTGCVPGDITLTQGDEIPAIKGPANVKATAYDNGVIRVTWDPAIDAKGYEIYRKTTGGVLKDAAGAKVPGNDGKDQAAVEATVCLDNDVSRNAVYYDDIVSYDNQLRNGYKYEYIIVAKSGMSTNNTSRNIDVNDIVLNASSKSGSVEAKGIKPAGEALSDPTGVDFKGYTQLEYNNKANFILTWNKLPGITYEIAYNNGHTGTGPNWSPVVVNNATNNSNPTKFDDPLGYYQFQNWYLTSPADSVEIRAKFETDYYLPSDPKRVPVPAIQVRPQYNILDTEVDFTATSDGSSLTNINLQWAQLSSAASFALYRRASDEDAGWTQINPSQSTFLYDASHIYVKAIDTTAVVTKKYDYALVVTGNNGGTKVVTKTVIKSSNDFLTVSNVRANQIGTAAGVYATINVTWNGAVNAAIYRASTATTVNTAPSTGWEQVGSTTGGSPFSSNIASAPANSTKYWFKVVATYTVGTQTVTSEGITDNGNTVTLP